jgi:ATP-dependent Clp protease ATP-binding subunit ClpA
MALPKTPPLAKTARCRGLPKPQKAKTRAKRSEGNRAKESALAKYCVDLNEKARTGDVDPLIGRASEVERCIQVLCRRRKNNPLLVGDPGVGKTAIAEGLARKDRQGETPKCCQKPRFFA